MVTTNLKNEEFLKNLKDAQQKQTMALILYTKIVLNKHTGMNCIEFDSKEMIFC